ncbi:MAG: PorV/PorQ family protein [candidate division KSB1 bacterium]|nr:PorV/PorQ family protein [candidate division KSB1 bacterium]
MKRQAVSAAFNLGSYGFLGINAVNLDNGDIKGTRISNSNLGYEDTGNLNVTEMAIGLTYAQRFTNSFGAGITVKYCEQDLIAEKSSVLAFDIGTLYNTGWNAVKVAVSVQHFSKEIKYIDENFVLPLTFRVGFSGDVLQMVNVDSEQHKLMLALEGVNPRDYSERVHIGSEYVYNDFLAIRGGYKFNYDVESFSLGVGFRHKGFQFDYSYSEFGSILGMVDRFSLVVDF